MAKRRKTEKKDVDADANPRTLGIGLMELPLAALEPNDHNRPIDETSPEFADLRESVKGAGVKVAIIARPHPAKPGKYEICDGERRWRAARQAGCLLVPVDVRPLGEGEARVVQALANLHREPLPPLEEGRMVAEFLDMHDGDAAAVAVEIGRTEHWVRTRAGIAKLSEKWRETIRRAQEPQDEDVTDPFATWTTAHLVQIARLPEKVQDALLADYNRNAWKLPKTAAALAEDLAERSRELRKAPWKLDDATLVRKAGSCASCTKRTAAQGTLFYERLDPEKVKKDDRCLDEKCWQRKLKAYEAAKIAKALEKHPNAPKIATSTTGPKDAFKYWEYTRAKKGDKDAVQAVVVAGPEKIGSTLWVKLKHKTPEAMRTPASPPLTPKKPSTPKEKLTALIDKLNADRDRAADEIGFKLIEDGEAHGLVLECPELDVVMALAGTIDTFYPYRQGAELRKEYKKLLGADLLALGGQLWKGVRAGALEIDGYPSVKTELILEAGGVSAKDIEAAAEKAVPEPEEIAGLKQQIAEDKKAPAKKSSRKGTKARRRGRKE